MKIVIALASSCGQISGVQRHAINLSQCLLLRDETTQVHLIAARWQKKFIEEALQDNPGKVDTRVQLHLAHIGNNSLSRNRWLYAQLPTLAARLAADIVHLAYPMPVQRNAYLCPIVVTLHDLYPYDIPENFGFPKVLFNRAVLQQCLHAADAIACVSRSTLDRLRTINPQFAAKKASLIYNVVEPFERVLSQRALDQWKGEPFLLCVAQHRRNKNLMLMLKVFERLVRLRCLPVATQLMIVGIPGPETSAIHKFLGKSGLRNRVLLLNGIPEEHLQWCYRNCLMLVAPSINEGFGLPVAEALLAGCRVVCSDIPAFRELGCGFFRFVPLGPHEEEAFAEAITDMLPAASPKPLALQQLSAPVIAAKYLHLYRSLLPVSATHASLSSLSFTTTEERQPLA